MTSEGKRSVILRLTENDSAKLDELIDSDQARENVATRPYDTVREISAAETIRRLIREAWATKIGGQA